MAEMAGTDRMTGTGGGWAIAEGVALVILGLIALFSPFAVAAALAFLLPLYLVIKGVLEIVAAFRAPTTGRAMWDVVFGVIAIIAGVALFARPVLSGVTLSALVIGFFIVDGIVRIVAAFATRAQGWGWVLATGIIDLILGIYLIAVPAAALFVLAIMIAVNILLVGATLIAVGTYERSHAGTGHMTPA